MWKRVMIPMLLSDEAHEAPSVSEVALAVAPPRATFLSVFICMRCGSECSALACLITPSLASMLDESARGEQ